MKRPCPGPWRLTPAGRARAAQASNEEVVRRLEVAGSRSPAGTDVATRLLIPRRAPADTEAGPAGAPSAEQPPAPRARPARGPRAMRQPPQPASPTFHLASTARA